MTGVLGSDPVVQESFEESAWETCKNPEFCYLCEKGGEDPPDFGTKAQPVCFIVR